MQRNAKPCAASCSSAYLLEAWQFSSLQPACKGPARGPPLPERYLGRTLGKYRVTRLIGAGAFAWVFEAVDLDLEIPVALKVLRPEFAEVPSAVARFRREATTAARLRHPNIVTIRDVGQADGAVFVAMDLLPLSLARRLEVLPRLPESEVVRFALDVAAALSIAHADGVVHRDIKPDNVLLGAHGEAVVADFGLASAFAVEGKGDMSRSPINEVRGTPHYFSPEQARGLDVDGRADLYALGVTCYRAATGKLPFEGEDWYAVARQHIEDDVVPPRAIVPELSEGFDAIVLRLLAKKPEHRFSSAMQLADALLALPSAPVSRGMSIVPTAITQVAAPYVHTALRAPERRRSKRAYAMAAIFGVLAVVAAAQWQNIARLFATPVVPTVETRPLPGARDTVNGGTTAQPVPDTDSTKPAAVPLKPPTRGATLKKPVLPLKVRVELSAPDSADLSVNGSVVGRGSWTGDVAVGRNRFRASLRQEQIPCWAAENDTNVVLSGAGTNKFFLDVGTCAVLLVKMSKAPEADFSVVSEDEFAYRKSGKIANTPVSFLLRSGLYRLRLSAERCVNYSDTVRLTRDATTRSDTVIRSVPLICN